MSGDPVQCLPGETAGPRVLEVMEVIHLATFLSRRRIVEMDRIAACLEETRRVKNLGFQVPLHEVLAIKGFLSAEELAARLAEEKGRLYYCPRCAEELVGDGEYRCPSCRERMKEVEFACARTMHTPVEAAERFRSSWCTQIPALGRFEVHELIGSGGMGEVYRGTDPSTGRAVAIKVVPYMGGGEETYVKRLRREYDILARLCHPNIVEIVDFGADGEGSFLVTEYLAGESLDALLDRGPLPRDRALRLVCEVAGALDYLHEHGVVHRDLKPSNLMVTPQGVKIIDFGISRLISDSLTLYTRTGQILGTPFYMPPEVLEGGARVADARSDIYSLGVILYQLLCGRLPFAASGMFDVFERILTAQPAAPRSIDPTIPRHLEAVCLQALSRHPERRQASAGELAAAIGAATSGRTGRGRRPGRGTLVTVISCAVAVLFFAGLALLVGPGRSNHQTPRETQTAGAEPGTPLAPGDRRQDGRGPTHSASGRRSRPTRQTTSVRTAPTSATKSAGGRIEPPRRERPARIHAKTTTHPPARTSRKPAFRIFVPVRAKTDAGGATGRERSRPPVLLHVERGRIVGLAHVLDGDPVGATWSRDRTYLILDQGVHLRPGPGVVAGHQRFDLELHYELEEAGHTVPELQIVEPRKAFVVLMLGKNRVVIAERSARWVRLEPLLHIPAGPTGRQRQLLLSLRPGRISGSLDGRAFRPIAIKANRPQFRGIFSMSPGSVLRIHRLRFVSREEPGRSGEPRRGGRRREDD